MTERDEIPAAAVRLADVALMALGAVAVWALCTVVYYYAWTRQRHVSNALYAVLYYGGPLALLLLVAAVRRCSAAYRVNLALLTVAVTATVLVVEVFTERIDSSLYASTMPMMSTLADSTDKNRDARELSRKWGVDVDARSAAEVIAALRRDGIDAVPIITASNQLFIEHGNTVTSAVTIDGQEVMPLGGVSNKITVLCNEDGQWIRFRSDQHGFNNPEEIWGRDNVEVAALGDSFTQGYCVPTEHAFIALIRRRHPATLNLGISGDGPLLMLATLKEYLPSLKPSVVLWFYYEGNDLTDLQRERKSTLLKNYLADGFTQQARLARQGDIDRAMLNQIPRLVAEEEEQRAQKRRNRVVGTLRNAATLAALRRRLGLAGGLDTDEGDRVADLEGPNMTAFRQVLVEAQATVNTWGGQMQFVYLPEWARYTANTSWGKSQRGEILEIVNNLGIPLIDVAPVFQANGDPLSLFPFRRSGHYNEAGHQVVADTVLAALDRQ